MSSCHQDLLLTPRSLHKFWKHWLRLQGLAFGGGSVTSLILLQVEEAREQYSLCSLAPRVTSSY